jgi:hypothetical protein
MIPLERSFSFTIEGLLLNHATNFEAGCLRARLNVRDSLHENLNFDQSDELEIRRVGVSACKELCSFTFSSATYY